MYTLYVVLNFTWTTPARRPPSLPKRSDAFRTGAINIIFSTSSIIFRRNRIRLSIKSIILVLSRTWEGVRCEAVLERQTVRRSDARGDLRQKSKSGPQPVKSRPK